MLSKFLLTTAVIAFPLSVSAQDLPTEDALQAMVAEKLPAYWALDAFKVVSSASMGDPVTPREVVRFEADATPTAKLFASAGDDGPFVLVTPTQDAGAARKLYGILDLTYHAGAWAGGITIENPVDGLDQPLDLFPRPALQVGSDDAKARLAALHDQGVQALRAADDAELNRMKADHSSAMADLEITQSGELAALTAAQAKALADARAAGEQELATLTGTYRTALADLKSGNEPQVAEARAGRERLLAAEKDATDKALAALRDKAAADLDALRAAHAKARGELIAQQQQELAEIETKLATEKRSLQRQLDTSQEVIALQKSLLASMAEINTADAAIVNAFAAARESRQQALSTFPKQWSGNVECTQPEGSRPPFSSTVAMVVTEVHDNGFSTNFIWGGRDHGTTAEIVLDQDRIDFPLKFSFATSERIDIGTGETFRLSVVSGEITTEGRMIGKGGGLLIILIGNAYSICQGKNRIANCCGD